MERPVVPSAALVKQFRSAAFALVAFAYIVAFLAAQAVVQATPQWHPLMTIAVADAAATLAVFVFSRAFNNSSFYDAYWSVAPAVIALWLALGPGSVEGLTPRQGLVLALVLLYAVRLTYNWARGWEGLEHEDWRYVDLRKKTGKLYWVVSLLGLHLMPTVMVYLGCLPLHSALVTGAAGFGPLDVLAAIVTLGAIVIEGLADEQLRAFRMSDQPEGAICTVGLWGYSRHPNYFGEISFWGGLCLFGVAAGAPWWAAVGVVAMIGLFVGVSIPLAEKRSLVRRPHYAEHQRKVSMLLPWFPSRS